MADLLLRADQIRSAPPEVKEWIRTLLAEELMLEAASPDGKGARDVSLAACSPQEASAILEHIRDDYLACQVFFELSRDTAPGHAEPQGLHRAAVADIMRHTRLSDPGQLVACLERIAQAFQVVRSDPHVAFYGTDRAAIYIPVTTQRSIKALWQALVTSRMLDTSSLPGMAGPAGPAEPIEAHRG
ncbi:hypothetical protein ABGN05_25835 [Aquibium sp. LZ166]|uniref:Uncharacterized protein n=1 Tax=Aquibium pacificus TaxID=3153579 RepID=A0ABV3SQJ0_9HYPH